MIKPLNNHCLIEVINEYDGIVGSDKNENVQKGRLLAGGFEANHLTASTGFLIEDLENKAKFYKKLVDKTVYWQEYADAGAKFDIDGKQYVLVPFYRLIGFEE